MSYIRLEPMPHENITLGPDERALEEYLVVKGRVILVVFSLIYILVGLPGNILTIIVLRGPNFRSSDISFYLTVMSCVNLVDIFLFLVMPLVSGTTGNPVENYNTTTCILTYWTFMAVLSVNSWLLTPLTLAKILSTRFRLVQSNIQQLAFAVSSVMVLCGATCGLLAIARVGFQERKYNKFIGCYQTRNLFVLTLEVTFVSLLPFMVVLGLFIYFFFMPAAQPERQSFSRRRSSRVSRRSTAFARNRRKSSFLMKISSAMQHFVLLLDLQYAASVLPTSTFYFFLFTHDTVTIIDEAREKFALNLAMLVHHLQVATNFVLFYFCDEEVRREMCNIVHHYVTTRRVSEEAEIFETITPKDMVQQKQDEEAEQKQPSVIIFQVQGTASNSTAGQQKDAVSEIKTPGERSASSIPQRSANGETGPN